MILDWVGVPAPSLRLWEVLLWGSAMTGTVKQEERETLLLAGSCTDLGRQLHGSFLTPLTPHFAAGKTRRGEGFSTNSSCLSKPCAPSKAPIVLCGKCGGIVLEIQIYFSVFSET